MTKLRNMAGLLALSLGLTALAPVASAEAPAASGALTLIKIAGYDTGAGIDEAGAEIVTYDKASGRVYLINGATSSIEIVDLSGLESNKANQAIGEDKVVKLSIADKSPESAPDLFGDVTSVAVHPTLDLIAAAVPNTDRTENGSVVFFTKDGEYLDYVEAGALPDMITATPDGKQLLVANEGEPNSDYSVDPYGSVSIIDITGTDGNLSFQVSTAAFTDTNIVIDDNVRYASLLTGYVAEPTHEQWARDFEPEFIVVSEDGSKAYVVLQESNAVAVLDLAAKAFTHVHGLGYKNYMLAENKLDPSDRDNAIRINGGYPVLGTYMPDGMALKTIGGKTYLFTANEGDGRAYGPEEEITDEARFKDIYKSGGPAAGYAIHLNAAYYPGTTQEQLDALNLAELRKDENLGRLKVITSVSDAVYRDTVTETTYFNALYTYGARSFSIWDVEQFGTEGQQVYDSADDFEQIVAANLPDLFNSGHDKNAKDDRSDDKGPEPEYIEIGEIDGVVYAFIGLERQSAIMVYNVTNPEAPEFVSFVNMRDVNVSGEGDLGPEGIEFIAAEDSPTGKPLLLTGNEVSGTLAVFEIWQGEAFALNAEPNPDAYAVSRDNQKLRMTVKEGVSGFKTFQVSASAVNGHAGTETVIFRQLRENVQIGLSAIVTDLDGTNLTAAAQFNVAEGDIIEVYIVDALNDDPNRLPTVLQ